MTGILYTLTVPAFNRMLGALLPIFAKAKADIELDGTHHVRDVVLPNVYFHVSRAYAILRHNSLVLGKGDFVARTI